MKVLVAGSLCLDYYQLGESSSPLLFPGGKGGNQAVAAKRLGADVTLVAKVGSDPAAAFLLENLELESIPTSKIDRKEGLSTGYCEIQLTADGQNIIRGFPGANLHWQEEDLASLLSLLPQMDCLLLQFEIPLGIVWRLLEAAEALGKLVILNMGPPRHTRLPQMSDNTYLVVNAREAEFYTKIAIVDLASAKRAAAVLKKTAPHVIITLGEDGALVATGDDMHHIPAPQEAALDPTGAGDTFCATLAVSLINGDSLLMAVRHATHAAALTTTALGAQSISP